METKDARTSARVDRLVRCFEHDVYAELFDFLRSREDRRDSLESQATDLTRRIMAHGKLMQETLVGLQQPDVRMADDGIRGYQGTDAMTAIGRR